jgi:lysophospholipid acyltransferase (LPLAT)-like uncharacterized protein
MFKRIFQSGPVQPVVAWTAGVYLQFVALTTRWQIEGEDQVSLWVTGAPCVVAFWHETLPSMPIGWLTAKRTGRTKPAVVLASGHRDGRLIAMAMSVFGISIVEGSSSRGGAAGLRRLAAALKAGFDVGLTPDGPRGPRRVAAAGVAQLAALSGAQVLPVAAWTQWAVQFRSWDRMRFPLPFGRGGLVFGEMITVPRHDWEAMLPAIETALTAAAQRAEILQWG